MRFLGWWIGFSVLLLTTRTLDLYLVVGLVTLMLAALSLRRRNKFLWKLSQALGSDPASYRLVASLVFFILGTLAVLLGGVGAPTHWKRVLLAFGFACYVKVFLNLLASSQEPYMKRRWQ